MSCFSMQTKVESSLSTRLIRVLKSVCWNQAEELLSASQSVRFLLDNNFH